jgi:aminodeoxyfutalosine synthase
MSFIPERHSFQTDDVRLRPIAEKILARERLDFNDGVALYRSKDVLAVGWLANHVRERLHGNFAYFNVNRHINPTNVCVAACRLCAFGRKKGSEGSYTMALEEAWQTAASGYSEAVTEFHIVGGLHPDLPFEYFLDLVAGLKERFPQVHIKAFTMVEVAYLARRAKLTIAETLIRMKDAGVDSLPGGGAEIFSDRVRHIICDQTTRTGWTTCFACVACRTIPGVFKPLFLWPFIPPIPLSIICQRPPDSAISARLPSAAYCWTTFLISNRTGRW